MTTTISDSRARFVKLRAEHDFVFVVYYRGHWCPFCMDYMKSLQKILPSVERRNGYIVAVTAEDVSQVQAMRDASGFTGEVIVDQDHLLLHELKTRFGVDVAISEKKGYPHGMAQPAIMVQKRDKTVLYSWAIVPSLMNLGGAKDRPSLTQIWDNVEATLDDKPKIHKTLALQSFFEVMKRKLFG